MLVVWQYRHATSQASQEIQSPAALHALLRVLDQRAIGDGHPHAVLLSASTRLSRLGVSAHNGGTGPPDGPQPELTLVVGADDIPVLWWDSLPAARQISVGVRQVSQPEPQDFFGYYSSSGQQRYAPESSLVSRDDSWQAGRLFLTSGGRRPATITWRTPSLIA